MGSYLLLLSTITGTSSLPLLDRTMIASAIIPFIASTVLLLILRVSEAKKNDYARKLTIHKIESENSSLKTNIGCPFDFLLQASSLP
jgi:hypothetical protein